MSQSGAQWNQRRITSGLVQASKTSSAGASKVRWIRTTRPDSSVTVAPFSPRGTRRRHRTSAPTTSRLAATAGLCAASAGAIFIGVQINHPPADVAHLLTTEMTLRESAKVLMAVLALAGFTGMFASHRDRLGRLGRAGYGLLTAGYVAMFAAECIIGYYLPTVAHSNPGYVQHVINAAMGHGPSGGIGPMRELFIVVGIGYSVGGLLFGIALFRAGVLARWASLLLAYGTASALALSVLPESFDRPFAVPTGVALIGLGVSLWRGQRRQAETVDAQATTWVAQPVTR
ncbi:MAG: hypothetical protein ACLP8S_03125 [Solirubrobacteraceae bacterium]